MDLQPVFNYYKAVSYMSAYFSKSELETSQALLQACSEIRSMNLHARKDMHKLGRFLFKFKTSFSSRSSVLQSSRTLAESVFQEQSLLILVYRQNVFEFVSQWRK